MIFDGLLTLFKLENISEKGLMPCEKLVKQTDEYFGLRMISYSRQYAALGANSRVDNLVRIWRNDQVEVNDYAVIDDKQYRIDFVQHLLDEDDLEVTDLTLVRLDDHYDVADEATGSV